MLQDPREKEADRDHLGIKSPLLRLFPVCQKKKKGGEIMNKQIILGIIIMLITAIIVSLSPGTVWGDDKPVLNNGTVTLPLQTFLDLTKKPPQSGGGTTNPKPHGDTVPVKYIFTAGQYTVSATPWNARVEGTISLIIYQSGWVEIPLVRKGMGISSAQLDGKDLPLFVKDESYHCMARGEGNHTLKMVFFVNTAKNGNTTSVTFGVPQTTVTNINASVPMTKSQVTVNPSIIKNIVEKDGRTIVEATVPSTESDISLSWTPKAVVPAIVKAQKQRTEKPKIYATLDNLLSVRQDTLHTTSVITYSILYNKVKEFSFAVSKDVTIVNVSGANFLNWEKKEGKDTDTITAFLSTGAEGSYVLTVEYEKPLKKINSTWPVPILELLCVERQKGTIGCFSEDNIELTMAGLQGASQIDEKDLPLEIRNKANKPIMLAFKYQALPYQISVETKKLEEVPVLATTIDTARAITVVNDEGNAVTTITYEMRNNQKQYMDLTLPPQSRLLGSFVNNLAVKPVKGSDAAIKIPLLKSKGDGNETFTVEITYITEMGGFGALKVKKALAPTCAIPISDFYWSLYFPQDQRVLKFGGTMKLVSESEMKVAYEKPQGPSGAIEEDKKLRIANERQISPSAAKDEGMMSAMKQQKVFEGATLQKMDQIVSSETKGVNPVKIRIPQVGRLYRFSKLLVIDKSPLIIAYFYQNWIYSSLLLAIFGLTLALGVAIVNRGAVKKDGAFALVTLLVLLLARPHIGEFFRYGVMALFVSFAYWLWTTYSPSIIDAIKVKRHKTEHATF
jgi:hypothetical protein